MPQPDLLAELRAGRPVAPPELRERVRLVAAGAAPPRRRLTWRRTLVVALPVAAAAVAAAVLLPGGSRQTTPQPLPHERDAVAGTAATPSSVAPPLEQTAPTVPAPSSKRLQRYSASLELRVANAAAVSDATKRAVRIADSLSGYLTSVHLATGDKRGAATLVLRIPVAHVREAVSRLAALGTIVRENVSIQDLQAQVDTTGRRLSRLRKTLDSWRALPQTESTLEHIAALTEQIQRLERGRAATVRTAQYATVHLQLSSSAAAVPARHGHGPLHGLAVAFRLAGIGTVYALALGTPLLALIALAWLLARTVRRRREQKLLSRP